MGDGKLFWVEVGWRIWGNAIWLPSGACIDLLPQILSLPPQFFPAPQSPATELLTSVNRLFSVNPNPKKIGTYHED